MRGKLTLSVLAWFAVLASPAFAQQRDSASGRRQGIGFEASVQIASMRDHPLFIMNRAVAIHGDLAIPIHESKRNVLDIDVGGEKWYSSPGGDIGITPCPEEMPDCPLPVKLPAFWHASARWTQHLVEDNLSVRASVAWYGVGGHQSVGGSVRLQQVFGPETGLTVYWEGTWIHRIGPTLMRTSGIGIGYTARAHR